MDRDPKFEVQFLLTVTIAVVTIIASSNGPQLIDTWVAVAGIILLSLHIVLLNVLYLLEGVNDWEMELVSDLREHSRLTFQLVTALIPYLLMHGLLLGYLRSFYGCGAISLQNSLAGSWFNFCNGGIMLIGYVVPILVTGVAMAKFRKDIVPDLTTFRRINFVVAPRELTISSLFEDSEPLFVKIENSSSSTIELGLEIDFPEGTKWRTDTKEGEDDWISSHSLEPDHAVRENIEIQYEGESRKSGVIDVTLKHDRGEKSESVEVLLEP